MNEQLFTACDETGKVYPFDVEKKDGHIFLTLKKESFRNAKQLWLLRELSAACVGDDGYYLVSRGASMMGDMLIRFTERTDTFYRRSKVLMSMYVLNTPDVTALVRVERNYKYEYEITLEDGVYHVCPWVDFSDPKKDIAYDDIRVEIVELPKTAVLGDFAKAERDIRLCRGEIRTLRERCESEAVSYARKYPVIRIRMGWKPSPSPVFHQTLENEPDMFVACTFMRVCDIADELKRQGVEGAELQLVGWNQSGHDGRFPQLFPADSRLGGDEGLQKAIDYVKSLGYRISLHTNLIDEYEIADTFTWDDIVKDRNGEYLQVGHYSGGYSYHVCLKKQLKNNRRDLPAVAALGTNGVHFTDVISIVEPDSCHAEDHPCYTREGIEIAQEIIRESRALFGAFSSEGTMDFALKDLDYGLYVSFGDGFGKRVIPFGDCLVPFFELTYHGIILYNPISPTVNYPIKDARERLLYLLRGGKPSFYFYSKFRTGGMANWMGDRDLTANGEDDLRESVAFVAKAAKDYLPHADRQFIYMTNYEVLAGGIEVATYEDGSRIVGNFSEVDAEYDGHVVPAQDVLFL